MILGDYMKKSNIFVLLLLFLLFSSLQIIAQESEFNNSLFSFNIVPRIWGTDVIFMFGDNITLWVGGGYESFAYFRDSSFNIVQDIYNESTKLEMWNADFKLGYSAMFNKLNIDTFLKTRVISYDYSSDSLFALNNLNDRNGIFQNSIFFDISWTNLSLADSFLKKGFELDNSFEYAFFNYLNNFKIFYPFFRISTSITHYSILLDNQFIGLTLNNRLIVDYLNGNTVPVDALARIGGISNPAAIGGAIRGIPSYFGDGYFKSVFNNDLEIYFKNFLKSFSFSVYAGIVLFFDMGITEGHNKNISFNSFLSLDNFYKTAGIGLIIPILIVDFRIYGTYFINKKLFSYLFEIGPHF